MTKGKKQETETILTNDMDINRKYEVALSKIGGRMKLTSILIKRVKELHKTGLKQKGSFNTIMEPLLDEILEEKITCVEPKGK
jgi:hypothetical protein